MTTARRGMTIVELIIALSLLSILALSAIIVVVPVGRQARLSREIDTAIYAVRTLIEEVHSRDYDEISAAYAVSQAIPVANLPGCTVDVIATPASADSVLVRFTVHWDSPDAGSFSRTFTTVRAR